jgi:L-glutamine:2-deoxy-scyllo-inosose/3-amino-2,3-dideoxy-scyllo-inosose aminotransferase
MSSPLALHGGPPAVALKCPAWPQHGESEARFVLEAVNSGVWSWVGPQERAFCEGFKAFLGAPYAMGVANGTVSMQVALQALGIVPGDEVIVPGLTWVATAQAALDIGASVVLVDIDPETWAMDPQAVRAALTPRTRALLPVHLYGCMADMDALLTIAQEARLKVVEDVAHQHGSRWRGRAAGTLGDAGSFSFQQSKVLTSGEGGAVVCRDPEVYRIAFALKQVGWTPGNPVVAPYDNLVPGNVYGHNYRMTEMQAGLLRAGLERLPAQTTQRDESAQYLAAGLAKLGGPLRAARRDPRVTCQAYYAMTMHFDPTLAGVSRDLYLKALRAEGFSLGGPYAPVYRSPLLNLYDKTSPIPWRMPAVTQNYATLKQPVVERVVNETGVVMGHAHLLGERAYLDQLLSAVAKVNEHLPKLRETQA